MTPRRRGATALALLVTLPCASIAQEPAGGTELALFDLDAQLKAETTVASASRGRSVRETPGVVTVLTRDELRSAGVRDLLEALTLLVPGFQAGVDVAGVVDVGFRGLWAHEGKVLLLVDGLEMNELLFGTLQLGNHYPVEQIQAIEVIRGPGSALYGGSAELAVVKVTTRGARELAGATVSGAYGTSGGAVSRRGGTVGAGGVAGDAAFSLQASLGRGNRSSARYVDLDGASFAMAGQAAVDPMQVNAAASWRGLEMRLFYDDYGTSTRDGYGPAQERSAPQRFRTAAADASFRLALADGVTVTPRVTYRRDTPWQTTDASFEDLFYDKSADRLSGRVTLAADLGAVTATVGAEAAHDRGWLRAPASLQTDFGGRDRVDYTNLAAFAEVGWDTPVANLVVGGRAEHHSAAGSSFVPRLALTKLWHPFHVKLLYARAFRAPAIENMAASPTRPERTRVAEAEVGWEASEHAYLGVNAFDARLDGPIVFSADPGTGAEQYRNEAQTGSRGVEAELRLTARGMSLIAQYAFYDAAGLNAVAAYAVPGHDDLLLGFAAHKATLLGRVALPGGLTVAPSLEVTTRRFAYVSSAAPAALAATARANVFASWRDLFVRGLELGAGVYDLFDAGTLYPQPYASGHAPLPGQGREAYVRLSWDSAP